MNPYISGTSTANSNNINIGVSIESKTPELVEVVSLIEYEIDHLKNLRQAIGCALGRLDHARGVVKNEAKTPAPTSQPEAPSVLRSLQVILAKLREENSDLASINSGFASLV
jgi:hypothetical protein